MADLDLSAGSLVKMARGLNAPIEVLLIQVEGRPQNKTVIASEVYYEAASSQQRPSTA